MHDSLSRSLSTFSGTNASPLEGQRWSPDEVGGTGSLERRLPPGAGGRRLLEKMSWRDAKPAAMAARPPHHEKEVKLYI